MSNDIVAVESSTAPTLHNQFDMVDVEAAEAFMNNYQAVCKALLDKSDYQMIQGKPCKKKSAWRKIATAFNLSDEIIDKEIIREDDFQIISARFEVKVTAPNGRTGIGSASCSIFDKIRYKATPKYPADTEKPSNFELRSRFNNAENDVIATAHTRAKSRAIGDLVGMGEVSAEELEGMETGTKPVKPVKPVKPKTTGKTSTMGNKPKTPKAQVKPKIEDAIEVEATPVEDLSEGKPAMSFKDLCDSNKHLTMCVKELQATDMVVNKDTIRSKLIDLLELGKLKTSEYETAKALLE